MLGEMSAGKWGKRPHTRIAQPESSPENDPEVNTEQRVTEQRTADAHMGGDRAAEIGGDQDRAQDRRARSSVEKSGRDEHDSQGAPQGGIGRPAERDHSVD